jgi:hypothetical protein
MCRYVVRVARTGDLAYRRRDSLNRRQILVIKAKRAEGRDCSTSIVKLASVPMLSNQPLYLLLMGGKMIIFPRPELLPLQKLLVNTVPRDRLDGEGTKSVTIVHVAEIVSFGGKDRSC